MEKRKMIHIRLEKKLHKQLLHLCVDKETSVQQYIERLIKENVRKDN